MTEIYTPQEWRSLFSCPSIVIDDNGYIYSAEEYNRLMRTPMGRIDYSRNNIYGKDYNSIMATPIAYMVRSGDVTKVYEYGKTQFSDPMLYIQNDKIYTPEEYTRWLGGEPNGYVKKDSKSQFEDVLHSSGKGSSNIHNSSSGGSSSSGGGLPPGCAAVVFYGLVAILIYILSNEMRIANVASGLALAMNAGMGLYLLWKKLKGELRFEWDKKRFIKGLLSGIGLYLAATAVLAVLGLGSHLGKGDLLSDAAGDQMELSAAFMGLPFVIRSLFLIEPASKSTKSNKSTAINNIFSTKSTYKPPKQTYQATKPASGTAANTYQSTKPVSAPKPEPKPAGTKIVTCPHCGAKCRIPTGKGKIKITCPNCRKTFVIES